MLRHTTASNVTRESATETIQVAHPRAYESTYGRRYRGTYQSTGCDSLQTESFELLLLQHQSQLGVYAKSKECQPGVDPYSRLKYQLFLESERGDQGHTGICSRATGIGSRSSGPDSSTFRAQLPRTASDIHAVHLPRTHRTTALVDGQQDIEANLPVVKGTNLHIPGTQSTDSNRITVKISRTNRPT